MIAFQIIQYYKFIKLSKSVEDGRSIKDERYESCYGCNRIFSKGSLNKVFHYLLNKMVILCSTCKITQLQQNKDHIDREMSGNYIWGNK